MNKCNIFMKGFQSTGEAHRSLMPSKDNVRHFKDMKFPYFLFFVYNSGSATMVMRMFIKSKIWICRYLLSACTDPMIDELSQARTCVPGLAALDWTPSAWAQWLAADCCSWPARSLSLWECSNPRRTVCSRISSGCATVTGGLAARSLCWPCRRSSCAPSRVISWDIPFDVGMDLSMKKQQLREESPIFFQYLFYFETEWECCDSVGTVISEWGWGGGGGQRCGAGAESQGAEIKKL